MTVGQKIDWRKIYDATSRDNKPTPGYLFNDIVKDVSCADPGELPAVATYLADLVDGDHAHVKLKALFVIKSLAYRVPPFCRLMQDRLSSVQEASVYSGPPSEMYGDEPYRLVREAAENTLQALTSGEHYHEQYQEMSQRIVGFGNFAPPEDTVLPDGTIDMRPEVSIKDVAWGTVGMLRSGVGLVLGGMSGLFAGPDFDQVDLDRIPGDLGDEPDPPAEEEEPDDIEIPTDGSYQSSPGTYVPPTLPPPSAPEEASANADTAEVFERLWEGSDDGADAQPPMVDMDSVWTAQEEEAAVLQELGIGVARAPEPAQEGGAEEEVAAPGGTLLSEEPPGDGGGAGEASIFDVLGIQEEIVASSPAPPQEAEASAPEEHSSP